ncbi:MAG: 50S ribosomal protein L33 [Microgenomates group bacterium GW2011_GWE1_47_12]|nr:MAG: 50S ribosomal protein L33 [Microgenomates group bacterium GW2011_GWE1_47_12]
MSTMAKAKKGPRQPFGLKCGECSAFNYITSRSKLNTPDKLVLSKYCPKCKKHTKHKESKKLK